MNCGQCTLFLQSFPGEVPLVLETKLLKLIFDFLNFPFQSISIFRCLINLAEKGRGVRKGIVVFGTLYATLHANLNQIATRSIADMSMRMCCRQKNTDTDGNAAGPSVSPAQSRTPSRIMMKVDFKTRCDYLIWVEMFMVLESFLWLVKAVVGGQCIAV